MMTIPLSPASTKRCACAALLSVCTCAFAPTARPQQTPTAPREPAGIYIPANQRHKGLSKFDQLPFTDRKLGDPDRYRALNPHFVTHENGQYYFLLDASPNTTCFDDDLKPKGVLLGSTNVPTNLGKWKDAKSADGSGKAVRYVYVKDKGYVLRRRLTPSTEIAAGKWFQFPLKSGEAHSLCDGTGIVRGTLAVHSVRLNYGQQKQINGETYYYAFSTSIVLNGTKEKSGASGWIKASALQEGNDPHYEADVVQKMQPPAATEGLFTRYELTGGDAKEKWSDGDSGTGGGKPIYKWGYLDAGEPFIAYKVLPGVPLDGKASVASTDYIKRNDDVINLGFNACGVSNDTYRVSSAKRSLFFYRSQDRDATAVVDLFYPKDALHTGKEIVGKMEWVYGYVDEKPGKRWGWVPLGALAPRPKL